MQHKDIVAELARRLERGEADVEALADGFASLLKVSASLRERS